jgi:hypothetical protein
MIQTRQLNTSLSSAPMGMRIRNALRSVFPLFDKTAAGQDGSPKTVAKPDRVAQKQLKAQHALFLELSERLGKLPKESLGSILVHESQGLYGVQELYDYLTKIRVLDEMASCASAYAALEKNPSEAGYLLLSHAVELHSPAMRKFLSDGYSYAAALFAEAAGNAFTRVGLKPDAKEAYLLASQAYKDSGNKDSSTANEMAGLPDEGEALERLKAQGKSKLAKSAEMAAKAGALDI